MTPSTKATPRRERRAWALDMAASLLHSDLDCMDLSEFDEDEEEKRRKALRQVANELQKRAQRMALRLR